MSRKWLTAAIAAITALGASASTFTVSSSGNSFSISRSGDTNMAETVFYRTVPRSAFPGQHYTEKSGAITFLPGVTSTNVTVTTCTPSNDAYRYQTGGTSRSYSFEVTDGSGAFLDSCNASVSGLTRFYGEKVSKSVASLVTLSGDSFSSGMSSGKYLDVSYTPLSSQVETSGTLSGYVLIDDSYDYAQKPATVSTANLVNSTGATSSYLNSLGYKIYAAVCFTEKERDDGYQYLQIVAGTSTASYDGADPNGAVNDPVNAIYKVCFELSDGSNAEGKAYFPHRGTNTTEFSLSTGKLWQQKYKSGHEAGSSGSVVLPVTTAYITTRFDAGGDKDDTWGYKDFFVRMALCETRAPAKLADPVLAPGRYGYGNEFYVSVPFSEIVTVTVPLTIQSDWGELSYFSGSGSNVLTFKGTINAAIGTQLIVRTLTGTVKDLAGNTMSTPLDIYKSFSSCTVEYPWPGAGTAVDPYVITTTNQLAFLASCVNATYGDIDFAGKFFELGADISYDYQYEWDNIVTNTVYTIQTEDNYTAIGGYGRPFKGTFDGRGHTISGIRITKEGSGDYSTSQGLFGYVGDSGTVKNIFLRDAMIYGHDNIGGIAGYNRGTIMDCTVYHVRVFAGQDAESDFNGKGPIAGYNAGTMARSHYRDCATLRYDGYYYNSYYSDLVTLSTVSDVAAEPATVESATIDGTPYYATGSTFSLSCSIPVPENWSVAYTATGGATVNDATLTLASGDTIVSAAVVPPVAYVEHWQAGSNHDGTSAKPYLITTPEGLQLLSDEVNHGAAFAGTYFQLGNDIDMGSVANFTPIGISSTHYFYGQFDGRGHSISHLTINQEGSTYVGLFGYIVGVVKNLGLCDASITGESFVGGIAGEDHGIIDNCCVARSSITAISNYVGAIAGSFNNGQGNTYHSTLVYGTQSSHVGGDAFNIGAISGDLGGKAVLDPAVLLLPTNAPAFRAALIAAYADPAVHTAHSGKAPDLSGIVVKSGDTRLYAVNVPADLSVSGTDVVLGSRSYFAPDSAVTLDVPEGYVIVSASYTEDSVSHDIVPVNGTYSFTMPAADVMVTARVLSYWAHLQETIDSANGAKVVLDRDYAAIDGDSTLSVTNAVTLDLNGHTIDANGRFRVLYVEDCGDLTLTNSVPGSGAITGGSADKGGGVYVDGHGAFTMTGGEISGNTANEGGGVYVDRHGAFTMTCGAISGNTASSVGGGVAVLYHGVFAMAGGEISDNAANCAGGVVSCGTFTMTGGKISGNTAIDDDCGGVYVKDGTFTMSGGEISGNLTDGNGGGVYVHDEDCEFTMAGGEISGNTAAKGGGVFVSDDGVFTMNGGEISGNWASKEGGGVYEEYSEFEMSDGMISGNTANEGGGVYASQGRFTMTGGTISGNTDSGFGGGVYVGWRTTFAVSGSPVVSGNTNSVGAANNVYLPSWCTIVVGDLSADASIGVTTQTTPPVKFADGSAESDASYFFSDNPSYRVAWDNYDLKLVVGTVFPAYLDGADDLILSNYVAWASLHGPDTDGTHETAFLLNVNPATAAPEGAALLKVVDFGVTAKTLHLELASDVCDLFQPEDQSAMAYHLCNGLLTLEVAEDLAAFAESPDGSVQKLTVLAPADIDSSGHAVVDLKLGDFTLPDALFVRPAITVKAPVHQQESSGR